MQKQPPTPKALEAEQGELRRRAQDAARRVRRAQQLEAVDLRLSATSRDLLARSRSRLAQLEKNERALSTSQSLPP